MPATFIPAAAATAAAAAKRAIVDGDSSTENSYFRLVRLAAGESDRFRVAGFECLAVVLSGSVDIEVGGARYAAVGERRDVWSGRADSVYCGRDREVALTASADAEIAIAGCRSDADFAPFRVRPEEVDMVEVGSAETKSRRRIFHILGHNGAGRTGNLLVSELYCDEGCWSGYPPHKHDTDEGEVETAHEEIYHYRFDPPSGFGAQFRYEKDAAGKVAQTAVYMTRDGDTFCFADGYHPTVTSPGHAEYIFTILVGKTRRPLVQRFDSEHRHLVARIPGIAAMVEKFK